MSTILSARMMVSIPIVMAILGVSSIPEKADDWILRESCESCTNRVRDFS